MKALRGVAVGIAIALLIPYTRETTLHVIGSVLGILAGAVIAILIIGTVGRRRQ